MQLTNYHNLPEKFAECTNNGFISAGDMARRDEDGFLYLVDRKANMIITGGEHVFPSEVEKILTGHASVVECAVIGLQDHKWGESVTAVCILASDHNPSDTLANELQAYCKNKLASFKAPKKVIFIDYDQMPRTGSGKVIHRILRERYNKLQ